MSRVPTVTSLNNNWLNLNSQLGNVLAQKNELDKREEELRAEMIRIEIILTSWGLPTPISWENMI